MKGKFIACLSGAVVALTGASSSMAQSGDAAGLQLEEVVVTATKVATDLQKTSISIQTYSGEQLQQQGKKRIDDIMNGVVGVTVQGSQVGSSFYMRGVESGGGGAPGGAPNQTSVAVLIDGIYQNRGEVVRGGTLDVAQVEVSRGTQSTNQGASAIAGAVSIVSNNPVFEYQANGSLEIGNYHLTSLEGVLNVPLASNQALRIAYSTNKRDGYISSGAGDSDLSNARLRYRWQASDALDTVFTVSHQNIGGNGVSDGVLLATGHWEPYTAAGFAAGGATFAAGSCNPTLAAGSATSTIPGRVQGAEGCPASLMRVVDNTYWFDRANPWDDGHPRDQWPNNPFRDTNIDSYSAEINWSTAIGRLTLTPSVQRATFQSSEPPRGTSWMEEDRVQHTKQMEARLASNADSRITWLAGLYYYNTDTFGDFQNVLFPGSTGMTPCPALGLYCYTWDTGGGEQTTTSAYANVSVPIVDTVRINGGVRYSKDEKSYSSTDTLPGTVTSPPSNFTWTSGSRDWKATTYSAGVEYDVAPQSMLYAKYQTGYQPGAISAMDAAGTPKLTLKQTTVGIKNRFFDNKLQLNIEAFDSKFLNRSVTVSLVELVAGDSTNTTYCPTAATGDVYRSNITLVGTVYHGCFNFTGTPTVDASSRGVDVELNFLPTSSDRIDTSVEYLQSKYRSVPTIPGYPITAATVLAAATGAPAGSGPAAQTLATLYNTNTAAYSGVTLQNSPEWSVNASYQHEFNLGGAGTLVPRLSAYYKSVYWTSGGANGVNVVVANQAINSGVFNPAVQKGYTMYDAYNTWTSADGKFSVVGYIKNATNKAVMTNGGGTYVSLAAPRTFGVTLSGNFQ